MFGSRKKTPQISVQVDDEMKKRWERELYETDPEYRTLKDRQIYQDKLLDRLAKAEKKYEKDKNLDALIKEYEYLFITCQPSCCSSHIIRLPDLYLKAGQPDKAWGFLNRLLQTKEAELHKIRFEQAKILTKEKKYADAILMHLLGYLAISEWSPAPQQEAFIKKVKPLVKKLKWDESVANDLASILQTHVNNKDFDAASMVKAYRNYCNYLSKK